MQYKSIILEKHRCVTPAILTTQEAEIRRIWVQSQSGQIVHKTLSGKYSTQKWMVKWLK
jgi:hypothetical protein